MKNLKTLYRFEMKKIFGRKIVWITVGIMLLLTASTVCSQLLGTYYIDGKKVDSNYAIFQKSRAYEKTLSGRPVDQSLLEETWDAYGKIPSASEHYAGTKEYWTYAFPYSAIFGFAANACDMDPAEALNWEPSEAELYEGRTEMLEDLWDGAYLTEGEKEYWRQQELSVKTPFVYAYKEGWWMLLDGLYTIGIITLLTIAVCLSSVFPVERARKTDQLIFCSCYGKRTLYLAKILAGISFAVGIALLYTAAAMVLALAVYGCDGFGAAFQLIYPDYSGSISVGQAVLISYGLLLAAAVLAGAFVMVLSEILKNAVGTLAVISGVIILAMFVNLPVHLRVLVQIWNYLPSVFLSLWNIFDCRLVPFAGTYLTNAQFAPILYLGMTGALLAGGSKLYQKHQAEIR